jgi:hypothetical protein
MGGNLTSERKSFAANCAEYNQIKRLVILKEEYLNLNISLLDNQ